MQGAELEAYLQQERLNKEKEAAQQAAMARTQMMLEADEDDSDSNASDSQSDDEIYEDFDDSTEQHQPTSLIIEPGSGDDPRPPGKRSKTNHSRSHPEWSFDQDEAITKQLLSYDIYLKGNVSRTTSFFKTAVGQTQRFRMFPFIERKRRVDEYGETVDVSMWLRKGKALENVETEEDIEANKNNPTVEETKVKYC